MPRSLLLLGTTLAALAAGAPAQTLSIPLNNSSIVPPGAEAPTPAATPTPFPSPVVPPAPAATPAPSASPTASAEPRPTRDPIVRRREEAPREPRRREPEAPRHRATPADDATPAPAATPVPVASATPAPIETVVLPHPAAATPIWPWLVGGALILLGLAALLLRRRREEPEAFDEPYEAEPPPQLQPELQPQPGPAPLPPVPPVATQLTVDLRPTRAGINLLTATVEAEVVVTNTGAGTASDIRAAVALTGASGGEAPAMAALARQPIIKPDTPPFVLAPGEERRFRVVAALPLDAIQPLTVAGRPLFVPLAVVTAQWRDGQGQEGEPTRRTTRGFAVGVERVDSAKLAPLWLDIPPRSYDGVAARPHGEAIETG